MNGIIFAGLLAGVAASALGQNTVVYVGGPSFAVPAMNGAREIDLSKGGRPDFVFSSSGPISTLDFPSSGMGWPFSIGAIGTNAFLTSDYAFVQPFAAVIGGDPPPGSSWSEPGASGLLTASWSSRNGGVVTGGWNGTLGVLGVGYLGVQLHAADGLHYGWMRVRLPHPDSAPQGLPAEMAPVVIDWAYEARPNVPLSAGVLCPNSHWIQLSAELRDRNGRPRHSDQRPGQGTFILTGDMLRCEITLGGKFSSASIRRPDVSSAKAKPVVSLGNPLVSRPDHTAFFAEAVLSASQAAELLHGAFYVTIDHGAIIGEILPVSRRREPRHSGH